MALQENVYLNMTHPLKNIPGYQLGYGIFFVDNFPGIISSRGVGI